MIVFGVKAWARILQKQLHHISFGKVLNKIGLDHFCLKSTQFQKNAF